MTTATGAQIIARTLRDLGVTTVFGIVGIPVVEIAEEAINLGIRFIAFRNEQACSYAASVYGYMTGRPGVCLVVGGPGVLHALAGVSFYYQIPSSLDMSYSSIQPADKYGKRSETPLRTTSLFLCWLAHQKLQMSQRALSRSWMRFRS